MSLADCACSVPGGMRSSVPGLSGMGDYFESAPAPWLSTDRSGGGCLQAILDQQAAQQLGRAIVAADIRAGQSSVVSLTPGQAPIAQVGMSGLGDDASSLALVQAAAQAVHMDVSSGRTVDQTQRDLQAAQGYLAQITPGTDAHARGQDAVDSAARDYQNLVEHQAGAQSASAGFKTATAIPITSSIDTGSGSVFYDAAGGTVADAWNLGPLSLFGKVPGGAVTGGPGTTTDQRNSTLSRMLNAVPGQPGSGSQALCESTGGRYDPNLQLCVGGAKSWCDALPWPIGYVCNNPVKAALAAVTLVGAYFVVPPLLAGVGRVAEAGATARVTRGGDE